MRLGGTLMQPIKSNFLLFQPIDWSFQLSKSQMQSVSINEDRFHYYCRSQYKDIFWPRVHSSRSDMSWFCLLLLFLNLQAQIRNIFLFLKFIYFEKATKFCEIFPLLLTTVHTIKSKGKISQNFEAFSEYMNFNC